MQNVIGVIGGMGPYAGADLVKKIFDQTQAAADQQHLPVALLSYPHLIPDRSTFLRGETDQNPAEPLFAILQQLDRLGASVAAMPCNTAHSRPIFEALEQKAADAGLTVRLVNMIEATVAFIRRTWPDVERVGVLGTTATCRGRLYADALERHGLTALQLDDARQDQLTQQAIFHPEQGIKACSSPCTPQARQWLLDAIAHLTDGGAEAVILGCTELPLAVPEPALHGVHLVDSTLALARALIRASYPEKLRPWGS